jgi:nucleoside-diphosphate-sugar epimerase
MSTAATTALVTGATGCLGRHLVDSLVSSGLRVRALVRESSDTRHLRERGVDVRVGSLLEEEDLRAATRGVGTVFHLGGIVIDDPRQDSDELWEQIRLFNVVGTERLARCAAEAGAERFVFCSSVRIFGFGTQLLWREDDPRSPSDLYSRGKAMAEAALLSLADERAFEVAIIRPRFIYGNHDRYVLPRLAGLVRRGGLVPVPGADAACDMVYVEDCVEALRLAAEHPVPSRVYNVTSGEYLTLREILLRIAEAMQRRVTIVPLPASAVYGAAACVEGVSRLLGRPPAISRAQVRWYLDDHHFSIARARAELGYRPRYPLTEALKRIDMAAFGAAA